MTPLDAGNWNTMPWRCVRNGIRQAVLALSAQNLSVTVSEVCANAEINPHAHSNEQIAVILDGGCDYHLSGETYRLKPGDWLVIPPNCEHYIHVHEPDRNCIVLEIFSPRRAEYTATYLEFLKGT